MRHLSHLATPVVEDRPQQAHDSQPAPSSPSQSACASPCPELLELAAEDAPLAARASRAPPAGAPAGATGAASNSRGPRLRPPPARVPLARRRRPSLARYCLSCVWRVGGKTKTGNPETCQL
eukprot:scaffold17489_cov107-Isochrysis_galbana.AAC.1